MYNIASPIANVNSIRKRNKFDPSNSDMPPISVGILPESIDLITRNTTSGMAPRICHPITTIMNPIRYLQIS
jgi:hypothetical protein